MSFVACTGHKEAISYRLFAQWRRMAQTREEPEILHGKFYRSEANQLVYMCVTIPSSSSYSSFNLPLSVCLPRRVEVLQSMKSTKNNSMTGKVYVTPSAVSKSIQWQKRLHTEVILNVRKVEYVNHLNP